MCLIAFAWQPNAHTTLLLAANRDEFHARPTATAHWWPEESASASIFAGRDLQARGTWMGVNRTGRFAAVTNLRAPSSTRQADAAEPSSRGALVTDFLRSDAEPLAFLNAINPNDYQGFNLLVGTLAGNDLFGPTLAYLGTRSPRPRVLVPGTYGLSNDALDTPWPKVESAKSFIHEHFGAKR